jgi:outer membrane receptor protein involved in Fe transport
MKCRRLTALLLLLLGAGNAMAADRLVLRAGVPVEQALEQLRAAGLKLVYSSVMVPAALTVVAEMHGDDPVALARDVLRPHGLRLRALGSGLYAVVADQAASQSLLTVRVIDRRDQQPVYGARVEVKGQGYVGWTDSDGRCRAPVAGAGPRAIRISASGFETTLIPLPDARTAATDVEVPLTPSDPTLEEITVVASRFSFDESTTTPFTLERATIIAQPKVGEDALQSIARLPGVAFSGFSGKPNIRGGESGETLVLLDGMPIREPYHLPEYNSAFSAMDENLIARLTTYTGPLPARYGNRLAAVVDLESVATDAPTRSAIGLSSFNARARIGSEPAAGHPVAWLASGRVGTLGKWLNKAAPDIGKPATSDAFFKAQSTLENGTEVSARGLYTRSRFQFDDAEVGEHAVLHSDAQYAWLSAHRSLDSLGEYGAMLGYSNIDNQRRGNVAGGLTTAGSLRDVRSAHLWDASLFGMWQPTPSGRVEAGMSLASSRGRYDYTSNLAFHPAGSSLFAMPPTRSRAHQLTVHRDIIGIYAADKRQLGRSWFLESGLRWDRDFAEGSTRQDHFSPRLATRWDISPLTSLRLSWGRAFQVPEAHELRVEDGEVSLPAAQRVTQTVLSLDRQFRNGLTLRVEGFDRRIPNPRTRFENVFDPLRVVPELSADRIAVAPDRSRMYGAEVSGQWEQGPWSIWGAYTWSKAVDTIRNVIQLREWDQRSTLTLSVAWQQGPWSASLFGSYRSGRPTTPLLSTALNSPTLGARNSQRLPNLMTFDARAERRFALRSGTLIAYAQITNLFNRYNRCCTELDLPDEESVRTDLEVQPLASYPLVPAIGLSYEF